MSSSVVRKQKDWSSELVAFLEALEESLQTRSLGVTEQLRRRTVFDQFAVRHEQHLVGEGAGEGHLVGDDHHRHAVLHQLAHHIEDFADQYDKAALYFTEADGFPEGFDRVECNDPQIGRVYQALFVSAAEQSYIQRLGGPAFEDRLKEQDEEPCSVLRPSCV